MTDNEIIKALGNLTYGGHSCGKCKHQVEKGDERCGIKGCNIARNALDLINRLKAEKEKCESQMKLLEAFVNDYKLAYEKAKAEIERYQDIESTIDKFWDGLLKLSMFKGKDKPTLEELLEYIEQVKVEAVQEKQVEIIKDLALRIKMRLETKAVLYSLSERDCEFAINQATALKAVDEIVAELTDNTINKLPHNSLCETETYEGSVEQE